MTQPLAEATAKLVRMLEQSQAIRHRPVEQPDDPRLLGRQQVAVIFSDAFGDIGALPESTGDEVEASES